MPNEAPITRDSFDETAARLGISGSTAHMDELFQQVLGVLRGTQSLLSVDVSDAEPDMAFRPSGSS